MINLSLFRHSDTVAYAAGQLVFAAGDPGSTMYVVKEGEVEIRLGDIVLEIAGPGSAVGEMALIDREPRSATVVAHTDCELVVIDQRRFQFLVQQTPYFSLEVMQVMADRLRRMDRLLASQASNAAGA
jgi:CRP/FNR family transcriptional regulator, cyclic AMP receptor protein